MTNTLSDFFHLFIWVAFLSLKFYDSNNKYLLILLPYNKGKTYLNIY
jgi:hypothetical protein